jgi:AcrR family transcriptional regulator
VSDPLLEAAYRVFSEAGFRGATTRHIAAEAGINEVTLFRRYSSKEDLIIAALKDASARSIHALETQALPDEPGDVEDEIGRYLEVILEAMHRAPQAHRAAVGEWGHHPAIDQHLLVTAAYVYATLDRYIAAAQEQGRIRADVSSAVVTQTLLGAAYADVLVRDTLPGYYAGAPGETARAYCAVVLRGTLTEGN